MGNCHPSKIKQVEAALPPNATDVNVIRVLGYEYYKRMSCVSVRRTRLRTLSAQRP